MYKILLIAVFCLQIAAPLKYDVEFQVESITTGSCRATIDDKTGAVICLSISQIPLHDNFTVSKNGKTVPAEVINNISSDIKEKKEIQDQKEKEAARIEEERKKNDPEAAKREEEAAARKEIEAEKARKEIRESELAAKKRDQERQMEIIEKDREEDFRKTVAEENKKTKNEARKAIGHSKAQTYKGKNTKNS